MPFPFAQVIPILVQQVAPVIINKWLEAREEELGRRTLESEERFYGAMKASIQGLRAPKCDTCGVKKPPAPKPIMQVAGPVAWNLLHRLPDAYPEKPGETDRLRFQKLVEDTVKGVPCTECAEAGIRWLTANPVDFTSKEGFAKSMCLFHNSVRSHLQQPITHPCLP